MEVLTTLVSSRGILHSCSHHNRVPLSSSPHIDGDLLEGLRPGSSIYVCTHALGVFAEHFLPHIKCPFTLVTGDSDLPVDIRLLAHPTVRRILEYSHLTAWFAQNLCVEHPLLHPLPIGLDYHTIATTAGVWSLGTASPLSQELQLLEILRNAPPVFERFLATYNNWHFELNRGDRLECYEVIERSCCYFESAKLPRLGTWERQAQMLFVVSPFGGGYDCHRTWEALALGCIPVVRRSPVSRVFEGLPVVQVEDWREVNRDFLIQQAQRISQNEYQFAPLFRETWARRIRGERPLDFPRQSLQHFHQSLKRRPA